MIYTERLAIREITADDWKSMQTIAVDFRASEYVIYDMPLPVEDWQIQALTRQFAESHLFYGVFPKHGGDMMGYVCFHENGESYDLGYCFHSKYQGMGFAFESCRALMEEMEKGRGVERFTAGTALQNIPSRRLLEKLGFLLNGTEWLSFCKDANGNEVQFEGGIFTK